MEILKEGLLKVDPGLLLWTIITFVILLVVLWKTAWRPIVDALEARAEKIKGDIEQAEKSRLEAEKLYEEHKKMMEKVKEEAAAIVADGKAEAEKLRNSIVEKANQEAKDLIERAKREIDLAKEQALAELQAEIVNISTEIASKIIEKNLNVEDQKQFVEEALQKMRTVQ